MPNEKWEERISKRLHGTTGAKQAFPTKKIEVEFDLAAKAINAITSQSELMERTPVIRKSIRLRNPYTDVLNLSQVELMRRWDTAPEREKDVLRHVLFLSINGIAAAMQSTG